MNEYVIEIQRGEDEGAREYVVVSATTQDDAETQSLAIGENVRNIAVYLRVR